jgi:uncharacterized protein
MLRKLIFFTFGFYLALNPIPSFCQEDESTGENLKIHALIRSYSDSIVIRWAPETSALWILGNVHGYQITRISVSEDSVVVSEILTPVPLIPWTLEQMMDYFGPEDTLAAVAAQAIYGESFLTEEISGEETGFIDALVRQHREQEMRFAFAMQAAEFSAEVATALGVRFTDKDVQQGRIYNYIIESLIPEEEVKIDPGSVITMCKPYIFEGENLTLDYVQSGPGQAEIIWRRDEYSAYFIERSENQGLNWRQLNAQPFFSSIPEQNPMPENESITAYFNYLQEHHMYHDSIDERVRYLYRIRGIDAFADLTPYSEVLEVALADITPPTAPQIMQPEIFDNQRVQLAWIKETVEPDLAGYYIQFSRSGSGPFTEVHDGLLPPSASIFTDESAGNRGAGYYRVIAIDHSGNQSMSFPVRSAIEDMDPPSKPSGLNGIIYSDAIAEIYWNPNPEPDVKGYRIFYANQADHAFVALTPSPIEQAWYRDTVSIKTLTRNIYYQVLAEDHSGNMSPVSDILELTRPDIIPPPVAVALDGRQDEENVYITWAASPANDVLVYRIFRKPASSEDWVLVKMLQRAEVEGQIDFVDTPPPAQTPWQYTMEVIDEAGLSSGISKVISFRVRGKRLINVPISFSARYDEAAGGVVAQWNYNFGQPHHAVLYRSVNGGTAAALRSVESNVRTFTDMLSGDVSASYYLQIFLTDGRKSTPSQTVSVSIP